MAHLEVDTNVSSDFPKADTKSSMMLEIVNQRIDCCLEKRTPRAASLVWNGDVWGSVVGTDAMGAACYNLHLTQGSSVGWLCLQSTFL